MLMQNIRGAIKTLAVALIFSVTASVLFVGCTGGTASVEAGTHVSQPAGSSTSVSESSAASASVAASSEPVSYDPPANEMRGLWVATAWGTDFPQTKNVSGQKRELRNIVDSAKSAGLNTIIFQVRTWSDAMYRSSIYPWSALLNASMKQGVDPGYDPLGYLVSYAHSKGIAVQAWINPYRVMSSNNKASIQPCDANPSRNPKYPTISYAYSDVTYTIYDPSSQNVRDLITEGVTEIVRNYDVDGIQFDDYFYPRVSSFNDDASYNSYLSGGGTLSRADWRRDNVNKLIKQVHEAVHGIKNIDFGVSPSGIWMNIAYTDAQGNQKMTAGTQSYQDACADTRLWVTSHWVDYICPQIYWSFGNSVAPYAPICDWWSQLCKQSGVKLYIGLINTVITGGQGVFVNSGGINEIQYARGRGAAGVMVFHSAELENMLNPLKNMF